MSDSIWWVFVAVVGIIFVVALFSGPGGERMTQYEYREQSLQYLEDIRNSNDAILEAVNDLNKSY